MSENIAEAAEAVDYSKFTDQKVILVRDNGDGAKADEVEGTVVVGSELGIVFKAKGLTRTELIEPSNIIEINFVPESKKLARRVLKPVTYGQARAHLLERHGLTLAEVNSLTEEQAFDRHNALDHEAADLGHKHEDKDASPAVQAIEAEAS